MRLTSTFLQNKDSLLIFNLIEEYFDFIRALKDYKHLVFIDKNIQGHRHIHLKRPMCWCSTAFKYFWHQLKKMQLHCGTYFEKVATIILSCI